SALSPLRDILWHVSSSFLFFVGHECFGEPVHTVGGYVSQEPKDTDPSVPVVVYQGGVVQLAQRLVEFVRWSGKARQQVRHLQAPWVRRRQFQKDPPSRPSHVLITPVQLLAQRELRLRRGRRSEEHTSELQSRFDLVCRLLLENTKILHLLYM